MTTQQPGNDNLVTMERWNELSFSGKEYCSLNEAQEIVLEATAHSPARILSAVNKANCEAVVTALSEKFTEVEAKLKELENEWQQADDKLKCSGKVARLKEYFLHANAIGNYEPLFSALKEKELQIDAIYTQNYQLKLAVTEKAEALKDSEDWRATTEAYRAIVEEWKTMPAIQKSKNEALWERIEKARNAFYDRKRHHQDDIEKEMMQNLDQKLELCEQAEKLAMSEDWRATADAQKEMMDRWKTIGKAASHEKNEELWQRFINARNTFFDRKKVHFEQIKTEQEANYALKLALVEQAESMQESTEWKKTSDAYSNLMTEWKKIGRVPQEKTEELWQRLDAARDKFFSARRQNVQEFKVGLEDNYAQKLVLVNRAEELQNSDNWRETSDELNELMTEWKKIGRASRDQEEELWERFIKSRKAFFARKDADRERRNARFKSQAEGRLKQNREFLEKIEEELREDEEKLKDFTESLANTESKDAKDEEIRKHLQNLIRQIESKLPAKRQKVEEVRAQLAELEKKTADAQGKS